MRIRLRVRPGAGRTQVGGLHDGALVVRVKERAVEGQATKAALAAVARALKVSARDVTLVTGATSRDKVVEIPESARSAYELLCRGAQLGEGRNG